MKTDLPRCSLCIVCCVLSVGLPSLPLLCFNIAILSKQVSSVSESTHPGLPRGNLLRYSKRYSGESVIVHFRVPVISFKEAGGCRLLGLPSIWPPARFWIIIKLEATVSHSNISLGNLYLLCSFGLTIFRHLKVHNLNRHCCDIGTDGSINDSAFY